MEFHQRLYEVRKRSGMTQSDLAEKLDVSRQAISRWEMGTAKPDFENLVAISELFGVSIDYLLKGEEEGKAVSSQAEQQMQEKEDENRLNFWEKLWLGVLIAYFVMALFFGISSGDVINGLIMPAIILFYIAVVVGVICLAVIIVREILKRLK